MTIREWLKTVAIPKVFS